MTVFSALFGHETRLLLRQRVFAIAAAATVVYAIGIHLLPVRFHGLWVPAILMSEAVTMGVLFIAATVFVERQQGVILALAVSPLETGIWMRVKLTIFTGLSVLAALLLLAVSPVVQLSPTRLAALALSALLYNQIGLALALWSHDIRSFLLPLSLLMGLLGLSIYGHLGVGDSLAYWLLPSYPAVRLLAMDPPAWPVAVIAMSALVAWNVVAYRLCLRLFSARIAARVGGGA